MITADWHKKVYKKKVKKHNQDEWQKLKASCLKRDRYTCQRCEKVNAQGRGLTAHHIIPRSEDGADEIHNLITLCDPCHDFVEINNLRSHADIIGSYEEIDTTHLIGHTKELSDEGYHFVRPSWHKFVYGGHRNE